MDAAGVPAGVFNLVHGLGPVVGACHRCTPARWIWSPLPAPPVPAFWLLRPRLKTVKRVHQELGGQEPQHHVLEDADLESAINGEALTGS